MGGVLLVEVGLLFEVFPNEDPKPTYCQWGWIAASFVFRLVPDMSGGAQSRLSVMVTCVVCHLFLEASCLEFFYEDPQTTSLMMGQDRTPPVHSALS